MDRKVARLLHLGASQTPTKKPLDPHTLLSFLGMVPYPTLGFVIWWRLYMEPANERMDRARITAYVDPLILEAADLNAAHVRQFLGRTLKWLKEKDQLPVGVRFIPIVEKRPRRVIGKITLGRPPEDEDPCSSCPNKDDCEHSE